MSEDEADDAAARAAAVAACLLGRAIAGVERLSNPERRNLILRCATAEGPVIVKQAGAGNFDPADCEADGTRRLLNDWLGPLLLQETVPGLAPRLLAGEFRTGLIVLEDLGAGRSSLVAPLLDGGPNEARAALFAYMEALAALHAATVVPAAWERYAGLLDAIAPGAAARRGAGWTRPPEAIVAAWSALLPGMEVPEACLRLVAAEMEMPGPFAGFIHRDPCPDNVLLIDGRARLIDFEWSRFGHVLLDACYPVMGFPTCWCAGRLPADLAHELLQAYRLKLGTACPAALSPAFDLALARVAAARLVLSFDWLLADALASDRDWGIATQRARLLYYLEAFDGLAAADAALDGLRRLAAALHRALARRWPDVVSLPLYPAFR